MIKLVNREIVLVRFHEFDYTVPKLKCVASHFFILDFTS